MGLFPEPLFHQFTGVQTPLIRHRFQVGNQGGAEANRPLLNLLPVRVRRVPWVVPAVHGSRVSQVVRVQRVPVRAAGPESADPSQ